MDKEVLVSDVEIEGRIMHVLHDLSMPVTLVDLTYVPDADEYQLIIATPWFDEKGPLETYDRIIKALQRAGIYEDVPIRRVVAISPSDPLARNLEREAKTKTEGVIHIIKDDQRNGIERYSLIFAPFVGRGGAVPARYFSGPHQLRDFLEKRLHIHKSSVDEALTELNRKRSASIFHVQLTNREAKKLGLA